MRLRAPLVALLFSACAFGPEAPPVSNATGAPVTPASGPAGPVTVAGVRAKMRERYGSCATYRDKGTLTQLYEGRTTHVRKQHFETCFSRPQSFYFSMSEEGQGTSYFIWTEDGGYKSWFTAFPMVRPARNLDAAIGEAAGVTSGVSWFIARMLQAPPYPPGVKAFYEDAALLPPDTIAGKVCEVLQVVQPELTDTLWVARDSGLVLRHRRRQTIDPRKVREIETKALEMSKELSPEMKAGIEKQLGKSMEQFYEELRKHREERPESMEPFVADTTVDYEPEVDVPIRPEEFLYHPPDAGS